MNSPRYGHTATLLPDGRVLLAGGSNGTAPVASAEIFDATTLTFSALANAMTSPREGHTATLSMNGQVLIAGGNDATLAAVNTAELFDPSLGTFTSLANGMTSVRRLHSAALLPNGGLLLTGGYINQVPIDTAELFHFPPAIANVPANIVAEATGPNGTIVIFSPPVATDSTGQDVPINCTPLPGATFSLGTTTVTCTAADTAGAGATATFNIVVSDTVPPVITTPADITVAKQNQTKRRNQKAGAVVSFAVGSVDTVDGAVAAIANPSSGSFFPLGQTTVDVTATDAHGNTSMRSFTVTVLKNNKRGR
jgi:hypothetical protein